MRKVAYRYLIPGFTLVEIMVVITIGMILLSQGIPSFRNWRQSADLSSLALQLRKNLDYARELAVTEKRIVGLCPSTNGSDCIENSIWREGWIVYTIDKNGVMDKIFEYQHDNPEIIVSSSEVSGIQFNHKGELQKVSMGASFSLCDERGPTHAKSVIINRAGRSRSGEDMNSNQIIEDHRGVDLSCS